MTLRPLRSSDRVLLRTATWLDLHWSGQRLTWSQVDADAHLAACHRLSPDDGTAVGWPPRLSGSASGRRHPDTWARWS